MNCTNPISIIQKSPNKIKYKTEKRKLFKCGQCINCKTARAREWTSRLMDELTWYNDICIIILTYDTKYINWGKRTQEGRFGTLWHPDVQKYIKRLRKSIHTEWKKGNLNGQEKELKYFIAGEYGDEKGRPHYHIVLYGLNGLKNKKHREIIEKNWHYGNLYHDNKAREVDEAGMRYVAQYVQKKIYDGKNGAYYNKRGITEPYNISSKGLGKRTALRDEKIFEENGYTYPNGDGKIKPVPRYYIKVWRQRDLDAYLDIEKKIQNNEIEQTQIIHEKLKIWRNSIDYKLLQLKKKQKQEKEELYEKEGIITKYTRKNVKKSMAYKIIKNPKIDTPEHIKIIAKKHKLDVDKNTKKVLYYYQEAYKETWDVQSYELTIAKQIENTRLKHVEESRKGII